MTRSQYDRLGWVVFSAWAFGAIVVALVRPGFLLEAAVAGVAGTLLWSAIRAERPTRSVATLAVGCALIPTLNTWPIRVYHSAWESRSLLLAALLSVSSLIAAALLFLIWPLPKPQLTFAVAAGALALAAAATSTAASDDQIGAAAGAWSAIVVPVVFGVVVALTVRSIADARLVLTGMLAGAIVPATAGLAAYVVSFGVPLSATDLVNAKSALFRTHLFQEITFGNVGHLADFALLLLPAALLVPFDRGASYSTRIIAAIAAMQLTLCLLLVLSRGALTIAVAALAIVALVALLRRSWAALSPAVVSLLFVAVLISPPVRGTVTGPPGGAPPSGVEVPVLDESASVRIEAAKQGLRVARDHLPWGVGSTRYPVYDPVHTAPHSLWILVVAELGVLGLASLTLVAALAAIAVWQLLRRPRLRSRELVIGSAVAGAVVFLADGVATGSPLTNGRVNVWAIVLVVLVVLLARASRLEDV